MKISERLRETFDFHAMTDERLGHNEMLARVYRSVGTVTVLILILFIILSVTIGYREFTYENVYYFVKDFDSILTSGGYVADSVNYGYGENRTVKPYKGGMVVAGRYSAAVYSATGRKTAVYNTGYSVPSVVTSAKYILIYDAQGGSFSVYNSFIRLYSEKIDGQIYSATINDNGDILILSSNAEYRSVLTLYANNFTPAATYYFKDSVTAMAISDDGKRIAVATVGADAGELTYSLRSYERGSLEYAELDSGTDELPLYCGMAKNGVWFLTDRSLSVYESDGRLVSKNALADGQPPRLVCSDAEALAFVSSDKTQSYLIYLNRTGDTTTVALDNLPTSMAIDGKYVYLLEGERVLRYDILAGVCRALDCGEGAESVILSVNGNIYICYGSMAVYREF